MSYQTQLDQVKQHVLSYFATHKNKKLVYHNLQHTEDVVAAATQIANHYQLNDTDFFTVIAAAWFHDVGYLESLQDHEQHSAKLAGEYLRTIEIEQPVIEQVEKCIMATQMPQQPQSFLEQIICDADLFHFGTADFADKSKAMRQEVNTLYGKDISKHDWRQKTIRLMEQHHYHTDYCQLLLEAEKQRNLLLLVKKESEWNVENPKEAKKEAKKEKKTEPVVDKKEKEKKEEKQDKGVQTMFRVSSTNHQRLSDLADNKANIMITVNSIILSAIISLLLRRLEDYPYFVIPTIIIIGISLAAMIFAILATRPSIPDGKYTQRDIDERKVNLLFFGNFYSMSLDNYRTGMHKVMHDTEYLYDSLITDIYAQGVVLGHKYRLLRYSYNIFMFGLVISVVAFLVMAVMNMKH
ncbi:HD domain-containing protein [Mucilaginibacter conchicola]|uniref:HD domain-containing protein n=1 Tax=Mucilaginibacter conchicola TaxID=2303333 RepID=A0A372NY23_9SPHI|nr:Pycsar system effector family protein [Mucilaginibacter conchicola]RFZ94771.1 HD domain-containing protein [Mucilaginibacter conchicola]